MTDQPSVQNTSPLLINEPPLQVLPTLAKLIGLNEALFLQQVQYWVNHNQTLESRRPLEQRPHFRDGRWWCWNTYAEWQEQFIFWSLSTVKRTIQISETLGVLITRQFNVGTYDRTKWYSIDYGKLANLLNSSDQEGQPDLNDEVNLTSSNGSNGASLPIAETTTETTTETLGGETAAFVESWPKPGAPKPKEPKPKKERPRDPLFDAIAEVCHVDPETAGPSIGKVKAALLKAKPPYTPEEVQAFGKEWWSWSERTTAPSLWVLKERIGQVRRAKPAPAAPKPAPGMEGFVSQSRRAPDGVIPADYDPRKA